MIHRKQTHFLEARIGALFTLIFITFFSINNSYAQERTLNISSLRHLAQQFQKNNQPFLSYLYNLSFYHLTADSTEKLQAGLDALHASFTTSHFEESKQVIGLLFNDYPNLKNKLTYQYGYLLMRNRQFGEGDRYMREVMGISALLSRIKFLRAYAQLTYFNYPEGCLKKLTEIKDTQFPYNEQLSEIKTALQSKPAGTKKSNFVAVPLSMIIPGSGQMYAGFFFDGMQSFGFNLVLGYATYASWRHELDLKRGDRNYVMPILSSFFSGLFYLSNIFNTVNSVNKANLYRQSKHYNAILEKFRIVMKNEEYFLDVHLEF